MMASSSRRSRKTYPPCPDGGWGWMVVFGSFMIHVIADGVMYSFGLFYYEFDKHFGASKTATSMVVSIMNGTTYCIGPIASALTIKFGCRAVTIAGAIFASLGFFLSTFASNIYVLYNTIGICAGFGFGLMYLPAIVIVTSYFEKKRAFATGIAVCGSGIGTAIMSPLIEYLIFLYGWKGAMLVISALILNCAIFGAIFKPVPTTTTSSQTTKTSSNLKQTDTTSNGEITITDSDLFTSQPNIEMKESKVTLKDNEHNLLSAFPISHPDALSTKSSVEIYLEGPPEEDEDDDEDDFETTTTTTVTKPRSNSFSPGFLYREDSFYSGSLMNISNHKSRMENNHHSQHSKMAKMKREPSPPPKDCCLFRRFNLPDEIKENISEMIDLSLMSNHIFLIFSISNFLTSIGYYIPYIYLKDWVVEMKIGSPQETGVFTSIIGVFSTISRLVFGYLSDQSFVNRLWLYTVSVTLCGLIIMMNTLATTYKLLAIFCALFGITCGTYVSLTSVVLVDLLSLEKLTNAFGLILLCQGVASILGPLFIGFIHDLSGAYDTGFHIIGSLVAFSGIMLVLIPICNHFKSLKKLFLY